MTQPIIIENQRRPSSSNHQAVAVLNAPGRLVMKAIAVTALVPLFLHMNVHQESSGPRHLSELSSPAIRQSSSSSYHTAQQEEEGGSRRSSKQQQQQEDGQTSYHSIWDSFVKQTEEAEQSIADFFHGEARALEDGIPFGGTEQSLRVLTERLAERISRCSVHANNHNQQRNNNNVGGGDNNSENDDSGELSQYRKDNNCSLRVVFAGGAQVSGRDVFINQTYPFQVEPRLRALAESVGLELEVLNNAMDSDLSREGPQTAHMCMENFVGHNVDIVGWDFESMMQGNPSAQIEAYVRWTAALKPALILFNRGGPHLRSRRGKPRGIVNLVGNHDATIFEDIDIPEQRPDSDNYRDSEHFDEMWTNQRNSFWEKVMDKYSEFLDFAAIDPTGSIYHLDHLLEFSNIAFDAGKALPLYDCPAPEHPPPCDQVPAYIIRHLAKENKSLADLPKDDHTGAFCGVLTGCRHHWYGGPRSHAVRAALNALPIVRAFHAAAKLLRTRDISTPSSSSSDDDQINTNHKDFSINNLPSPDYCSKFCDQVPTCMTTYVPNVGRTLGPAIVSNETFPASMPRLGACHYAKDPDFQISNLDKRFGPLGWKDRKYGFRLAKEDPKRKKKKAKKGQPQEELQPLEASRTAIGFNTTKPGPVVMCEPPCFIDECSPNRKKPFVKHATVELDGKTLVPPHGPPHETEVGGMWCRIIARNVPAGNHILRLSTEVVAPDHVMFSHLITFS